MVCLHTLLYSFTKLDLAFPLQIQSTYEHEPLNYSFDKFVPLLYRSTSNQEETNLTHLSVTLPIHQQFLVFTKKLD